MRAGYAMTLALCLAVAPPALAQSTETARPAAAQRGGVLLDEGWRFHFGEAGEAPAAPGFADGEWQKVALPHSWNRLGSYGPQRSAQTDNRQGIGWYRLAYKAPTAGKGKRHYLDFAAVSKIADVWVNGTHVGTHKGAFGRFRFDVTALWKPGATNLIAVRADNSPVAPGSSTAETIPLAGDFFVHGGIYRDVSLLTVNDAGFDLLDHGGPGLYARATTITADRADIAVLARLRNGGGRGRNLRLTAIIRDADGREVARAAQPVRLGPGTGEQRLILALPRPRLWHTSEPYLYTITGELADKGKVLDRVVQPLGVRSFSFDADKGFTLNQRGIKLRGVSRHQDRPDAGWGLSRADHAEDMALIKEMGANTVRQAHYQHADAWSDEADRAGMVVWAELPYVTSPGVGGGKGSPELWANAEEQLRELIRQNYNHPSIMMWSVGNEVDSASGFGKELGLPLALLQRLNKVAKDEDPDRPTTFADCCEDQTQVKTAGEILAGTADLIGYNRYFGWYAPDPFNARKQLGDQLDKFHVKHPTLPISISEYGAGGAISQHSDDLRSGVLNPVGRPHPEEYLSLYHEMNWPAIAERDFVFAGWVWNMFDFASDLREEGDSWDINDKGLVTADRKVKKDAFYYYKAQWSADPTLHLNSQRYTERPYSTIEVKAYSNAERASLTLNGQAIGEVACPDRVCLWPSVRLAPGANQAVVTATVGGKELRDEASWTGPDPAQGLRLDAGDIASHGVGGRLFGSDTFVTGGTALALNTPAFGTRRAPQKTVSGDSPELYEYWREGAAFSYAIPLPDGRWTITVHTFEPGEKTSLLNARSEPKPRLRANMTILANGRPAVPAFNVATAAGGELRGLAKSFPVTVRGGTLRLDFRGAKGGTALVAAIEVSR